MEEETKENLKVKTLSKWTMFFAALWIVTMSILKWVGVFPSAEINDIIYTGVAVMAIWSPTYISIVLDKIKDIRFGGN